ncbi:LOW QUALITY PROTEIN: hypothetical protein HID58_014975, partial [Brassica napus]
SDQSSFALIGLENRALWRERVAGFLSGCLEDFSSLKIVFWCKVKPALMWGDNSSIDSSASFFRWSTMVTSARFSCFVPLFLHQSAFFSVVMLCSFVSPDIEIMFLKCCGVLMVSLHGSPVRFSLVWLLVMFPLHGSNSFLEKEKHYLRWLAHPVMFAKKIGSKLLDVQMIVTVRIIGASPVSNMNFYKLLRSKTHVVLYPGLYVKLCTER